MFVGHRKMSSLHKICIDNIRFFGVKLWFYSNAESIKSKYHKYQKTAVVIEF